MSLAGIENRSKRLQAKKTVNSFWTPINGIFVLGAVIVLSTSSFFIVSSLLSAVNSFTSNKSDNPTSIPWINNKSECQHSGRHWYGGRCWDDEHSSMF